MSFDDTLTSILQKYYDLEKQLSSNLSGADFVAVSKEYASVKSVAELIIKLNKAKQDIANLELLLTDSASDDDLKEIAQQEQQELKDSLEDLHHQIKVALLPKDKDDEKSAILEVRAGTGGDEAGLFAADLFRMYSRYAEANKWQVEIISLSESEAGGYKEIIASINGKGVFAKLKFESGGHRVQRIPETETNGRIHTSAATVAVLPEAEEVDINIDEKDLRIDIYRASGAGGQHVNTTESAVRITHIPTGIAVAQQDERSQHKNKAKAMKILMARLYDHQKTEIDSKRAQDRKTQIGTGDRSERIRTYNFPQGRVTDHRINLTLYKLDKFMEGELDEMIGALISQDQALKLSSTMD